ncbi:hypothetical protein [Massilia sp. SYSU DXS3249]
MKSPIATLAAAVALFAAAVPAMAQTNVSISVGQPGFYGRLDIGDFGPPPVVYTQPVIVREVREVRYRAEPLYLRVPPGHRKNWKRYCGRYDACARPVMFVRDDWYTNTYAPRYRERHHGYRAERHHVEYRDHDRHDKHDKRDKHDKHDKHGRGHGNGHGNGHGRGH